MGLFAAYKRWRHRRGFGVHSPFAFRVVNEVIRLPEGYGYYGYRNIAHAMTSADSGHTLREARMLLRLAALTGIGSTFLPKEKGLAPYRAALKAANSRMRLISDPAKADKCDLVVSTGDFLDCDRLAGLLAEPGRVLCLRNVPHGWHRQLFGALPEGVMFYSPDDIIIIHRPQMAKVAYSINF